MNKKTEASGSLDEVVNPTANIAEQTTANSHHEEENDESLNWISFKNPELLARYVTEIYKISCRRFNGLSAMQQRTLKKEVNIARILGILPFIPARKK